MAMGDGQFVPVTITRATAQSLHRRDGYSKVVYRLSAAVPGGWIAGFDATCRAAAADWPEGYPTAHADRIEVMLPEQKHADRPALVALKARLEAAIAATNGRYGELAAAVLATGAREVAWEQQVLTALQATLDEQFPG